MCHLAGSRKASSEAGRDLLASCLASCDQPGEIVNIVKPRGINQLTGAPATSAAEATARRAVKHILI